MKETFIKNSKQYTANGKTYSGDAIEEVANVLKHPDASINLTKFGSYEEVIHDLHNMNDVINLATNLN